MASRPDAFDVAAETVAKQRAYGPLASAQYQDAERAARANEIARQIGLPPDAVQAAFPDAQAEYRMQQGQTLAATTPQAANWLSSPGNAAAVSNDYSGLTPVASAAAKTTPEQGGGILSSIGHFFGDVGSSMWNQTKLSSGRLETLGGRMMSGMGNNLSAITSALPVAAPAALVGKFFGSSVTQQGKTLVAQTPTETEGEKYWNDWHYSDLWRSPTNIAKKFGPSTIYSLANSVPALAETMLGRGAPLAADITEQTAEARARNNGRADPNTWDYAVSLPVGIISAALFRHARVADVAGAAEAGSGSILKGLGETAGRDAAIGASQAAVQYTGESLDTNQGWHLSDFLARAGDAAVTNAALGVALHGTSAAVMAPIRRMRDVAIARDGAEYVDNVMGAAEQAKSRTQAPNEFQSFVDEHVKDSPAENLYIPAEAITALFQTTEGEPSARRIGQDPFWSKYASQVDEARQLGGDVVVPLSDIATHLAQSGDWKALRDQVRFSPGGMSLAEAREYSQQRAPEDVERAVNDLSDKMDQAAGDLHVLRRTYQFGRDLGLPHDQAVAFGAVQRDWLMRRNQQENELRVQRGEQPLTPPQEWEALNLKPLRTTQEAHAGKAGEPLAIRPKTPAPVTASGEPFDAHAHVDRLKDILSNRRVSVADTAGLAGRLGLSEEQTRGVLGALASRPGSGFYMKPGRPAKYRRIQIASENWKLGRNGKKSVRVPPRYNKVLVSPATEPQLRRIPIRKGPIDVISFLRGLGGLRDDKVQGNDLRNVGNIAKHPGLINNRSGMSIDEAGEVLHEAGYFSRQADRPYTDEVLDLIDRASINKIYRPEEALDGLLPQTDEGEQHAREQIHEVASGLGVHIDDEVAADALDYMARGETAEYALKAATDNASARLAYDAALESGDRFYEELAEQIHEGAEAEQRGGGHEEDGHGPGAVTGDPAESGEAGGESGGLPEAGAEPAAAGATGGDAGPDAAPAQSDAFGARPDDHANWLRGLAEERLRSDKEQKAPGSDGGLFDNNGKQDTLFQPAYHGSPHVFDRFSSDHIVTGEGEQIYGHGLYFASNKDIAKFYRDTLSSNDGLPLRLAGQPLDTVWTEELRDKWPEMYKGLSLADQERMDYLLGGLAGISLKDDVKHVLFGSDNRTRTLYHDRVEAALEQEPDKGPGRVYHVDIPEDHEYLLWDKPLSEQPDHVKEAMKAVLATRRGLPDSFVNEHTAGEIYRTLNGAYAKPGEKPFSSAKDVSDALHEAGIAGIKYLDNSSRALGEGTHNYVVFDDSRVSIQHYEQSARGNISIAKDENGNPIGAVIRAFEGSDVSTGIHEMGHYWVEDLRARAMRAETSPQIAADWQAVKEWFAENGHPVGDGDTIPEAAHELWARGVERYIMEGKAPSQSLKGAFARLAQWMRQIYQTVTALNAPISDKMRDVMDRMLAADSEIDAARADMKIEPLEGAEALMTESERQAYRNLGEESRNDAYEQLLERVMEKVRTRRTREYNEQKRAVKDQVATEVDAMPVHRALKMMRQGEDGERVKIPRQWLVDNYGEGVLDRMPKGIDPIHAEEGHDPEEIAQRAGFDSADEMVRALEEHAAQKAALKARGDRRGPRQAQIDETTKQRVETDIPDPYQDIEQEARAAIANDRSGDLLSMEARALSRKTSRKPTPWAMAREWAKAHIQTQTTRDALTGAALARYSRTVAKAGKLAEEALMRGEFDEALSQKNRQILNAALLAEAKQAKELVEKAARKLTRIANASNIPSIDQGYLYQAHALLDQVRMGNESGLRVKKIQSFETWYNQQLAEGREPIVPIEYARLLGTQHWTSMPVRDLLELNDVVSQIVNLGRLKQKLIDGKAQRDYEEGVSDLVETQQANPAQRKQTALNAPRNSLGERVKAKFRSADAIMLKFEQLMNFMDGAQPNGPWQRMLMNPISAAQAKQGRLMRPLLEDIKGALAEVPKEHLRTWTREVATPELKNWIVPQGDPRFGQPWRFTKDQLVAMALNLGNEGNKQRLLDGYRFNEADVRAVIDRNLSAEEWKFVQNIWDTVGKLWPDIEAMEKRVNGFAPEKVEATPVETPHGTLDGGYFPAIYDPLYSSRTEMEDVQKLTGSGYFSVNTRAGATYDRAESVKRPLLLSIGVVTRHLHDVVHDIAFREPAAQVRRLLKDDRVRQAINNLMGPEYHKNSLEWLENVAKPDVADSKQNQTIIAFARALNKRITTAGLGFRISTILQQPTAFSNTMAEVGNVRYAKFFAKYLQSPVESWKQVSELSEEMRERAHNLDANISYLYEQQSKNKLVLGPSKLHQLAFKGIAATDLFITIPGWLAAFDKATTDLKMNDDEAIHYADMVIRKTQGAGSVKDQAAIQRTIWMKAFNPFFSYWSAHYNQLRSIGHETRRLRDADHMFSLANRFFLAAILPMAIQGWFFGGPQGQDESDIHYLIKQIIVGNLGALPMVGPVVNHFGYGYAYKVSPWSRFEESAEKTGKDIKGLHDYETGDGEEPKSWIKDSLDSYSYLTGQPTSQLGATLQGIYDYHADKAHPQNLSEWSDLLTKGKVPQHDR